MSRDVDRDREPLVHLAPDFDLVSVHVYDDGQLCAHELHVSITTNEWCIGERDEWLEAAGQLRRIATGALQAAEWLEANQ